MGEIIIGVRQSILTEDAAIQRRMGYAKMEYAIHADAGANEVLMFASKARPPSFNMHIAFLRLVYFAHS